MKLLLTDIADLINAEIIGESNLSISGPCKIDEGIKGMVSFLAAEKYEPFIYTTEASAVIVDRSFIPSKTISCTLLKVDNVYQSLALLMNKFATTHNIKVGIASTAIIGVATQIKKSARVGHHVVIEDNVIIGEDSIIYPDVFIGSNVSIGSNTVIYSGVKLYHGAVIGDNCIIHSNSVIGADGFGFTPDGKGGIAKIQQLGNVVIEDNVEIGAGCTIDRATMGSTIIRKEVKIDNMVHIAHNVTIDEQTFIAAQTGVAGSTKIGKYCMIGGQVGNLGHIQIADHTSVKAKSGI